MMCRISIMVSDMTIMIKSVIKFVKVFLNNFSKKCEEIIKILVLDPHDHVGGVT